MKYEILKLLSNNAKYTAAEIATMLGASEAEVENNINELEKDGFIRGYKAVIDWDKLDGAYVSAIVELKVVPKAGLGFEEVAEKVMGYKEVEAVYLMSGNQLATIDSVNSTATHFVMRRYKEMDVQLISPMDDDRGQIWV